MVEENEMPHVAHKALEPKAENPQALNASLRLLKRSLKQSQRET